MWRVVVLVVVLSVATVFGLWWRSRNGRITEGKSVESSNWSALGFDPSEAKVTLVQFSSAFCAPCRATRVILDDVARVVPGVRHVEVDAESHLDTVRALDIRRTPTVLFVGPDGEITQRASGQPRKAEVLAAVASFVDTRVG